MCNETKTDAEKAAEAAAARTKAALDQIKLHNELTRLKQELRDSLTEGELSTKEELNKLALLLTVSEELQKLDEGGLRTAIQQATSTSENK